MLMFCSAVVVWSMKPSIVTFGAGAWANTGGARTPRRASTANATVSPLLITASSCIGVGLPCTPTARIVATPPRRAWPRGGYLFHGGPIAVRTLLRRPLLQCPPQPGQENFHPPSPRALRYWVAASPAGDVGSSCWAC